MTAPIGATRSPRTNDARAHKPSNLPVWMNRLGGVASTACAAHCVVMAAAPALVSAVGLGLPHEAFEWGLCALAVCFASVAAVQGYLNHRTWWGPAGFGAGVLVLLAGRLSEALALHGGVFLAVGGGGLLVACHAVSLRRARAAQEACCP